MGYTNYWDFKHHAVSEEQFATIVKDIKRLESYFNDRKRKLKSKSAGGYYRDKGQYVELFDGLGEKRGVYYDKGEFYFNGDASKELDHEGFGINVGRNDWSFCKTARKPYDLAVKVALIMMKVHVPTLKVSSDGGTTTPEEWKPAFETFKKVYPELADQIYNLKYGEELEMSHFTKIVV